MKRRNKKSMILAGAIFLLLILGCVTLPAAELAVDNGKQALRQEVMAQLEENRRMAESLEDNIADLIRRITGEIYALKVRSHRVVDGIIDLFSNLAGNESATGGNKLKTAEFDQAFKEGNAELKLLNEKIRILYLKRDKLDYDLEFSRRVIIKNTLLLGLARAGSVYAEKEYPTWQERLREEKERLRTDLFFCEQVKSVYLAGAKQTNQKSN
jgi:hypothetical protein